MKVLQAEKKQSKAESDSAIERLRTDMEKSLNSIREKIDSNAKTMLIGMGVSVAFLVGLISFLSFLLNGST